MKIKWKKGILTMPIARFRGAYKRRSIQLIISLSFTAISIASMAFMGIAFYTHFMTTIRENAVENNNQILNQVSWNLNTYLRNMMSVSDTMYYNVIKNKDLTNDTINNEMNLLYEANDDNLAGIVCATEDGAIISAAPNSGRKAGVDITKQSWFINAMNEVGNMHFSSPHVQNLFENNNFRYYWVISLSRNVELTNLGNTRSGVLLVDMNYSAIEQMFEKVNEQGAGYVYLMDKNGEIIYHPEQKALYSGLVHENNSTAVEYEDGSYVEKFEGKERAVVVKTVGYTGWKIVCVIPTDELSLDNEQQRLFMLMIATVTVLLILFGNAAVSHIVTDPIRRLEESITMLEQQEEMAEDAIVIGGSHEIRHLGRTIKSLVKQMRNLTDDMVRTEKEKRKSELDALQSQINPHFLYNTLDSVVWMVESERYQDAIDMVKALAGLFRISLSKGNHIITIKDEIQHATNYMNIQQVRFKNKFETSFDIDPEIENCATVKLIVQPLLENAIYYGVVHMDMGEGEIKVHGYEKDGDIYIEVSDNGMGIPEDVIDTLLVEKAKTRGKGSGIGLWNVNQRISLYFKGNYGLSIESELDEGTTVTIHLPKIPYEEYKEET